ncbi:MAG TPA: thioesterase family protein, partial [Actinomycetaceae bacterium]|nr:thioesterase family protein [Actinomycetaceae bacterium]
LRWSDIDGYGHVNNAAMLTVLEEARIATFWHGEGETNVIQAGHGGETLTFIAHQEIEYLAPISYQAEPLQIELWLARIGGASLDVCYEIPVDGEVAVRAMTTVVTVDPATGRPRRITAEERRAWEPLVGDPVTFRRDLTR